VIMITGRWKRDQREENILNHSPRNRLLLLPDPCSCPSTSSSFSQTCHVLHSHGLRAGIVIIILLCMSLHNGQAGRPAVCPCLCALTHSRRRFLLCTKSPPCKACIRKEQKQHIIVCTISVFRGNCTLLLAFTVNKTSTAIVCELFG
jgi:hypothetical protein